MSWTDPCLNCGDSRATCECGDWNGYKKREEQKKETWIKNVMKIQEFTREMAEESYEKIFKK